MYYIIQILYYTKNTAEFSNVHCSLCALYWLDDLFTHSLTLHVA